MKEYEHKSVVLEGTLELAKQKPLLPVECTRNCRSPYSDFLVGIATTETGASNIANVGRLLEILNGRDVRVTVEWNGEAAKQG